MKVLHVITTINRGGAENHLIDLVGAQVRQGLAIVVAYLKGDGYWAATMGDLGVRVEPLGLRHYGEIRPLMRLRAVIRAVGPDIVHAHMPPAEFYARLALLGLRPAPVMVISKHNDEPFFRCPGQAIVGHWVSQRAAHVIAISDAVNIYIHNNLKVPASRRTTIRYGIDPVPYETAGPGQEERVRVEWGIPPEAWVVGAVARLVPQKAVHIMLDAYARYRALARQDSRLVIVGRGPLERDLKARSRQLGLEDKVIWAGYRDDIPAIMNAFDAFILTSSYEGFGLVLLEAMAAARPVVASRVSAIPEIVEEDVTGHLCRFGNQEEFARALLRLEDAATRARLGAAGRERARTCFALGRMADATLSVYNRCLV